MAGPNIRDVTTCGPQFFDGEAVNFSVADWTPTKATVARALLCVTAGTAVIDAIGITLTGGNTSVPVAMATGQTVQCAVTKVHRTGSSGSFFALY